MDNDNKKLTREDIDKIAYKDDLEAFQKKKEYMLQQLDNAMKKWSEDYVEIKWED